MSCEGVPGSPLGIILGSLGSFFGVFGILLAAVASLGGALGVPWDSWDVLGRLGGDFRDFPGNSGRPFGSILSSFIVFFCSFVGLCFLIDF